MNSVLSDFLAISPWVWLLVPVLSLLLIQILDHAAGWRDAAVRIASGTLVLAGCAVLLFLAVSRLPW